MVQTDPGASRVRKPLGQSNAGSSSLTPGKPSLSEGVPARLPARRQPDSGRGGAVGLSPEADRRRSPGVSRAPGIRGLGQNPSDSSLLRDVVPRKRKVHEVSPSSADSMGEGQREKGVHKGSETGRDTTHGDRKDGNRGTSDVPRKRKSSAGSARTRGAAPAQDAH